MKTLRLPLAAAFWILASILRLGAADANSRISAVTVYADRAVVTRTATIAVPATGPLEIVFANLPATLVEQSLQVSGRGTAQATILDVTARAAYLDFTPNERVKVLEDELRGLQKQRRGLDDHSKLLDEQRASLGRVEAALTSPANKDAARPTLEDLTKLLSFLGEQRGKLVADTAALDEQREELQVKIDATQQQLNELRGARGRTVKNVTVRLAAASPGQLDLALCYAVPGAGWTPAYDARLRAEERAVELAYFGVVRNGTGEDWKEVALTLSTARPALGGGAPELPAWIVDVAKPMPAGLPAVNNFADRSQLKLRSSAGMATWGAKAMTFGPTESNALAEAAAPVMLDAAVASATVESAATSATFKITTPVTLPADNTTQKVAIATAKLAANLQFQATPKLSETAFLSAYVTNSSDYPLLAGAVSTFLDDTFVAASSLKTVMPGEKFELALGADEGIAIKRKLVNRFAEDTGLTSKYRRVTYEFLVTVTNNKKTAEKVVFKDVVPVSRDEKIEVKLLAPAERDLGTKEAPKEISREEDGKLVWRLNLKPGEKRELPLKFSVEYPAGTPVTGVE
ncbi:MAG TPA: mucoidy inhibitor MuiA family protein [Opitutaceae bacterium]|nr:mucoidy inhibitor MuiA family protein [Opitutaceae bacterium]